MATLTLHDVPDELILKLQQRAREHGRSLVHEAVVCLESMVQPDFSQQAKPSQMTEREEAVERQNHPLDLNLIRPQRDKAAQLARFSTLRSRFQGPPIPDEELVAATERDSH